MPRHNTTTVAVKMFQMAKRTDGRSGETLLAPCTPGLYSEEEAAEKYD